MEHQNNWKYCTETTNHHQMVKKYKNCVENIKDLTIVEGGKNPPFNDEKCLNLDKVEGILAQKEKREARKTMDMSFGIVLGNQRQFLLCEYRLNYKNVKNLKRSEMDSKISNSRILLGHEPAIHKCYLFIFNSKIKHQAYSILRRLFSNRSIVKAMDVNELKEIYFN